MKSLVILGSTGSIGTQTVEVAEHLELKINAISGYANDSLLEKQARRFNVETVWISERKYSSLKTRLADTSSKVVTGEEELERIASETPCDVLVNSLVGISGLKPTLAALDGKKRVALANKETLVVYGDSVMKKTRETGTELIPVDSEHSAIFQCLDGRKAKRILLTCSGGAFYGKKSAELENTTVAQALAHPNWSMGAKITVDCATLMNKGLELIEAVRLFDVSPDDVEVLIHRESICHSAVEFDDNVVMAQLSLPDMRECIQYALTYPERRPSLAGRLDLTAIGKLTFSHPDEETFPLLPFARDVIRRGGIAPAAMNGANEAAVALFLEGKIGFNDISRLVMKATEKTSYTSDASLTNVLAADKSARENVASLLK